MKSNLRNARRSVQPHCLHKSLYATVLHKKNLTSLVFGLLSAVSSIRASPGRMIIGLSPYALVMIMHECLVFTTAYAQA